MSKKDQLIESIKKNEAYQGRWPYDPDDPLKYLDHYVAWLGKQLRLMETVAETSDKKIIEEFCVILNLNGDLWHFLEQNKYTTSRLIDFAYESFPKEERENLFRLYRIWIQDQYELIENVYREASIQEALGSEARESIRGNIAELSRLIQKGRQKKGELKEVKKSRVELAQDLLGAMGLKWDLKKKSSKDLIEELDKHIRFEEKEAVKWDKEEKSAKVPSKYKESLEAYHKEAHAQAEQHRYRLSWMQDMLAIFITSVKDVHGVIDGIDEAEQQLKGLRKSTQKQLDKHIKLFQVQKKTVDKTLRDERRTIQDESEELYQELMPLLEHIAQLNNEIQVHEQFFSRHPDLLEDPRFAEAQPVVEYKTKKAELEEAYERKDQAFLRLGYLRDQMDTIKGAYTGGIQDEKAFEEHAQRQLDLIKTIPKIEEAMNIYCSNYKVAFPLFLWVGSYVHGDGDFFQSKSVLGKGMDLAFKLPLTALGLLDMQKVKGYDTGSMALSLKLGLSIGVDAGITAKIGLAVEYNAAIKVSDNRSFDSVSGFTLKAAGKLEIPKIFSVSFELELAKWQSGFTFQDHYHWSAWLAARWSHFVAKAWACDVYMNKKNIGPDERPSQQTLKELDELTAQFLSDNPLVQDVYAEIRQYLDFPVKRSSQRDMFPGGKVNMGFFSTVSVEIKGSHEDTELFIVENENGNAVEYVTEFKTYKGGGKLDLTFAKLPKLPKLSMQVEYALTEDHPTILRNGATLNILTPVPSTELAVRIIDVILGALTSQGQVENATQIKEMVKKLFTDGFKLALESVLKEYAKDYLAEKQKLLEMSFVFPSTGPTLQFLRTRLEFSKKFEKSIPVYKAIHLDLGASFQYVRTCEEIASWHSLAYVLYLYYSLQSIARMKQPKDGKLSYTVRPDNLCGQELWEQYAKANKHQLWHLFVSIGQGASHAIRDLEDSLAKTEARDLRSICEKTAGSGKYKLTTLGEGVMRVLPGYLPVYGQAMMSVLKPFNKVHDLSEFGDIENSYKMVYPAFKNYLDAEFKALKAKENSNKRIQFRRVIPAPKTVEQQVSEVFKPQDSDLIKNIGWAAQLSQETYKHIKACTKCLSEVQDYDEARYVLAAPVIPEKYWVDDVDQKTCGACNRLIQASSYLLFKATNKHHCRICGGIFCDACCPERAILKTVSSSKLRVCTHCVTLINSKKIPISVREPRKQTTSKPLKSGVEPVVSEPSTKLVEGILGKHDPKFDKYVSKVPVKVELGPRIRPVAYTEISVSGDGNCLFRAIAVAVNGYRQASQNRHKEYREMAVDHMRTHTAQFHDIDETLDEAYLTTMRQPAMDAGEVDKWGGGPELAALSRALRKNIVVHMPNTTTVQTFQEEAERMFFPQGTIHILFKGGDHYSAYKPN